MPWIDTHCHLDAPEFDADRDAVVGAARTAGVAMLVLPAVAVAEFEAWSRWRTATAWPTRWASTRCVSTQPTTPTSIAWPQRCTRAATTRGWSRSAKSASTTSCPASIAASRSGSMPRS